MQAPISNSRLCRYCQAIFHGVKRIWIDRSNDWEQYTHSASPNKSWVDCVYSSAEGGCWICRVLSRALAADASLGYVPREDRALQYSIMDKMWGGPKNPDILYAIVFTYYKGRGRDSGVKASSNVPSFTEGEINTVVLLSIIRQDAIQHLLPDWVNGRSSTNSEQSWQCISRWMNACLENHTRCHQEKRPDWWPTRLLDLGTSLTGDGLRLIVTSETPPSGPYMTLSHRWGLTQIAKLTEDNLEALKESIPLHSLPKTFQDAITAAKRLGVRYLWIDSLCIIQDSSIDWQAESSQMSEVYQNGLCNLSATGASDSEGGLFFDRDEFLEISPCKVLLSWNGMDKVEGFAVDSGMWERFFAESPLISRAWVVQERILSPRVIHFGRKQLGWECHEQEHCETYPRGFPPSIPSLALKNLDQNDFQEENPNDIMGWNLSTVWYKIVRDYSKRDLTVESDKEAAISGIATRISKLRDKDTLIAGLWKRNLLKDLCWYPDDLLLLPQNYRAPSWSWLSVDGCISVHRSVPGESDEIQWARIDECQVNRANNSPLSPILSGNIRLRGTLQKIRLSKVESNTYCDTFLDGLKVDGFHARHDMPQRSQDEPAWCLLVYTIREVFTEVFTHEASSNHPDKKRLGGYGIILSQLGNQENQDRMDFKRIGAFTSLEKGMVRLLTLLLESTTANSKTHKRWKEFLHRHDLSRFSPSELHAQIQYLLDEAQLDRFYEFLSDIDFEDLPLRTITIW